MSMSLLIFFILIFLLYQSFYAYSFQLHFHRINPRSNAVNALLFEEFELKDSLYGLVVVNIFLGTPPQQFFLLLDSGSTSLVVASASLNGEKFTTNKFNQYISQTYQSLNISKIINYGTGSASGIISSDVLTIGNWKIPQFKFILANFTQGFEEIDGILGIGYYSSTQEANQFPILTQLYSHRIISRQIFTQKFTQQGEGYLTIGEFPQEIRKDMNNYGTCKTVTDLNFLSAKNSYWNCQLRGVFFGNVKDHNISSTSNHNSLIIDPIASNAIEIDLPTLFDTGSSVIVANKEFMNLLKKSIFRNFTQSQLCIFDTKGVFSSFLCKKEVITSLPEINFVFGSWALQVKSEEMFQQMPDGEFRYLIIGFPSRLHWIVGEPFLKKYHIVFDRDNDEIGFYSVVENKFQVELSFSEARESLKRGPEQIEEKKGWEMIVIFTLGIFLCLMIVLLWIWRCLRKRKKAYYSMLIDQSVLINK